ncbi:MAG: 3-hydroxyacyl-CoA dehydrogenase [Rhodobacteraceae bacterium]|nr:3-hydroxyacyl-CoA dehydrogenase [Paracoccaceae bacterium]
MLSINGKNNQKKKVALIGCGLIGQSWAISFLSAGFDVSLFDPIKGVTRKAKKRIEAKLIDLQNYGLLKNKNISDYLNRIHLAQDLSHAVGSSIYVQESGPEDLDIKRELTKRIDAATLDDIPIASSTSGIPTSLYASDIQGRYRCIVAHPINPPHLIKAVEIVPAPFTSKAITQDVKEIITSINKEPLELKKEIPGFVVNRLQGALLSEAFNLVKDGISTAEDIDKAISQGLGLRWSFMGPFQTIHLNAPEGIAGYVERYENMYREMFNKPDMDWSSVVKLGLEKELLNLYPLSDKEKHEKERDDKLTKLFLHKIKP